MIEYSACSLHWVRCLFILGCVLAAVTVLLSEVLVVHGSG